MSMSRSIFSSASGSRASQIDGSWSWTLFRQADVIALRNRRCDWLRTRSSVVIGVLSYTEPYAEKHTTVPRQQLAKRAR